jgi:HK97 family phage portal protein
MGILASALRAEDASRRPDADFWYSSAPSLGTFSGVAIGAEAALQSSPVWAATRLIADSVAMTPIITYSRRRDGGKDRAPEHPVYELLHDQPNQWQTAYAWKRMMMVHALLWGNGYSRIVSGPRGTVDQLIPLHPDGVRVQRIAGNKTYTSYSHGFYAGYSQYPTSTVRYQVLGSDGVWETVNDEDIFHLPGLSLDGVSGLCLMRYARESIALEIAAKRHSALAFGQGTRLSGILKVKGTLGKEAKDRLIESWQENKGGLANHFKSAILDDNADWIQTGMNNQDAQLLEQLNWSVEDVARFFNVPLHMIQHTSKETSWGSGIEQISLGFVTYSLLPWLTNWEQTIGKDLITARRTYFAEFLLDNLLRGDTKSRYEAYQIALGGNNGPGWMDGDEVRIRENMNPRGLTTIHQGPTGSPSGPSRPPVGAQAADNLHLRLMVRDAAARIVRKEISAMDRAFKRTGGSGEEWAVSVREFYSDHAAMVSAVLGISRADADRYALEQQQQMLIEPAAMDYWEGHRIDELAAIALGGEA